jgi:hypothetical protein
MATIAHHLHRIRQKPNHIKRHIAFWTSFGITLVIVIFWLASMAISQNSSSTTAIIPQTESPWSAMTASMSDAWTSFKTSLGGSGAAYQAPQLEVTPGNQ